MPEIPPRRGLPKRRLSQSAARQAADVVREVEVEAEVKDKAEVEVKVEVEAKKRNGLRRSASRAADRQSLFPSP
jgi:hypothetical protein